MLITIIPVKPLNESKTRLATVLSPAQRAELSDYLLRRTLGIATQLSRVVVVSRSETVRDVAVAHGAAALTEQVPDLNQALEQGIAWAVAQGANQVLLLPLDLPYLTLSALEALLALALANQPSVVMAPCQHQQGTNALLLTPPQAIQPHFGPDSFVRHRQAALLAGCSCHIYQNHALAFDLDTIADWEQFTTTLQVTSI